MPKNLRHAQGQPFWPCRGTLARSCSRTRSYSAAHWAWGRPKAQSPFSTADGARIFLLGPQSDLWVGGFAGTRISRETGLFFRCKVFGVRLVVVMCKSLVTGPGKQFPHNTLACVKRGLKPGSFRVFLGLCEGPPPLLSWSFDKSFAKDRVTFSISWPSVAVEKWSVRKKHKHVMRFHQDRRSKGW